jgi:hypothetical protein
MFGFRWTMQSKFNIFEPASEQQLQEYPKYSQKGRCLKRLGVTFANLARSRQDRYVDDGSQANRPAATGVFADFFPHVHVNDAQLLA